MKMNAWYRFFNIRFVLLIKVLSKTFWIGFIRMTRRIRKPKDVAKLKEEWHKINFKDCLFRTDAFLFFL